MKIEVAVTKLLDTAHQTNVKPERLANMLRLTIRKVAEASPVGVEALKLVQRRILKEAIASELKIGTRQRRRIASKEQQAALPAPVIPLTEVSMPTAHAETKRRGRPKKGDNKATARRQSHNQRTKHVEDQS